MTKKIFAAVIMMVALFALLQCDVFAANTLPEAVNGVITLTEDVTLAEGIVVNAGENLTLNLNGHTLSMNTDKPVSFITNNGTLTIKDGTVDFTGGADNTYVYATNTVTNMGILTVENVTLINNTVGGASYVVDNDSAGGNVKLIVKEGAKLNGNSSTAAIRLHARSKANTNDVVVEGGEIIGKRAIMIQCSESKNAKLLAKIDINGGIIKSTDNYGFAIYSYSDGANYDGIEVNISAGTFEGYVAFGGGSSNGGTGSEAVNITGGNFNELVFTYNNPDAANINISGGNFAVVDEDGYTIRNYVVDGMTIDEKTGNIVCAHKNLVKTDAKEAICPAQGNIEYWTCGDCAQKFSDAEGLTVITDIVNPVVKHNLTKTEKVDPTCTAQGNIEYWTCGGCAQKFSDAEGKTLVNDVTLPVIAHDLEKVEKVAPTEEKTGVELHYVCSECEKMFWDAEGKNEITNSDDLVIPVIPVLMEVEDGKVILKEGAVEEVLSTVGTSNSVVLFLDIEEQEISSVNLPVASLDKVAEADKDLVVEISTAKVSIEPKALKAIIEKTENAENITIKINEIKEEKLNAEQKEAIKDENVVSVISAEIICNSKNISDFGGGKVIVSIPFTPKKGTEGKDYSILYVSDEGKTEVVPTKYENGCLVAELEHFSEYVIVNTVSKVEDNKTENLKGNGDTEKAPVETDKGNPNIPNTGDNVIVYVILAVVAVAGVAVIAKLKRVNNKRK